MADDLASVTNTDTDADGSDDRFDINNTSTKRRSAYLGTGGIFTGDVSPASRTMVPSATPAMTGIGGLSRFFYSQI
jgi:hypothetical protein